MYSKWQILRNVPHDQTIRMKHEHHKFSGWCSSGSLNATKTYVFDTVRLVQRIHSSFFPLITNGNRGERRKKNTSQISTNRRRKTRL